MKWIGILLVFGVAACGASRTYSVSKTAVRAPQLSVTQVKASTSETRVTFEYAAGEQTRRVGIHAAGEQGAFVLIDADTRVTYALRKASGITTIPERTTVEQGNTLRFVLVFDPIPPETRKIHVGEGEYAPASDEVTWQVRDIELTK